MNEEIFEITTTQVKTINIKVMIFYKIALTAKTEDSEWDKSWDLSFRSNLDFVILFSLGDCCCSSKGSGKLNSFNKVRFQQMCICCCPFTYFLRFTFSLICQRYLGMRCWINRIHCAHISFHFAYSPPLHCHIHPVPPTFCIWHLNCSQH